MNKRDIAYQLSEYSRWEIFKIIRATMNYKKYQRLTKEKETIDELIEELDED